MAHLLHQGNSSQVPDQQPLEQGYLLNSSQKSYYRDDHCESPTHIEDMEMRKSFNNGQRSFETKMKDYDKTFEESHVIYEVWIYSMAIVAVLHGMYVLLSDMRDSNSTRFSVLMGFLTHTLILFQAWLQLNALKRKEVIVANLAIMMILISSVAFLVLSYIYREDARWHIETIDQNSKNAAKKYAEDNFYAGFSWICMVLNIVFNLLGTIRLSKSIKEREVFQNELIKSIA